MPKKSQFIKGSDAFHATKSLPFVEIQKKNKLNKRKGTNQSGKTNQIIYVQNKTKIKQKSRKIRFKN